MPPLHTTTARHNCGCQGTNDILPKLVSFFRGRGHQATSYSHETQIPKDLGLGSACLRCQLETESGVEMAINAIHCGPDSLIEHGFIKAMFVSLIELRLREDNNSPNRPETHDEEDLDPDGELAGPTSATATARRPWDWENIWYEFAKAFELRRDRVNVAELLRDLAKLPAPRYEGWWVSVLRQLGAEALLTFEVYVSTGLISRPQPTVLSALRSDVRVIRSINDLFDVYVNIDSRVHGYLHAHKMLRIKRYGRAG
ncbi:hypothetical protein F4823DRAFT_597929 [Ustulina deusta]|nr:hypothetical protein F4823DRAFT_597929 [Ustulina deusta]